MYFEVDSKAPSDDKRFAFLESKKYRIKTQKMCKVYSQGLLMSLDDFPELKGCEIGADVTEKLKVTYYVAEDNERKSGKANSNAKYNVMCSRHPKLAKKKWFKWFMRRKWGKRLMFFFFGKKEDTPKQFPDWIKKTDEERCENIPHLLENKEKLIVTEKIDGTSVTYG